MVPCITEMTITIHQYLTMNYYPIKFLMMKIDFYRQMMLGNWVELFLQLMLLRFLKYMKNLDIPMQSLLLIMMMRLLQVIYFMSVKLFMQ